MSQVPGEPLWWQRGVVYQVYPRSFQDSSGDGVGDLPGITARLEYLAWLGVDALWLSPFYPSPQVDFGYDVSNFTDVDPTFGRLADFDALVARAHALGLAVIIDYVANHTSDQHPWFQAARAARSDPHRDWYLWADARADGAPPNNWLSIFGGSAWEWDAATEQFYLHSFHPRQPDLNWRAPAARAAMLDVLRFWLARGVDGFRIDAAHFVLKDPQLRDNPPNRAGTRLMHRPLAEYDTQQHLYDREHEDIHPLYREIRHLLESYSSEAPRVAIGELHLYDLARWARYYGERLDELHLPFNFGLLNTPWRADAVRAHVEAVEAALPAGAWPNYVVGNHDEPRVASRLGAEAARLAMCLLLTLRGTPTLYYGDELGLLDATVPPERQRDRADARGLSRDPQRAPMPWDATPHAGFCPPDAEPWLPLTSDHEQRNVAAQQRDPRSPLALTRALLQARRASPALASGSFASLDGAPEGCWLYERRSGDERRLVALNFRDVPGTVAVPADARLDLSTYMDRAGEACAGTLPLRPYEGALLTTNLRG